MRNELNRLVVLILALSLLPSFAQASPETQEHQGPGAYQGQSRRGQSSEPPEERYHVVQQGETLFSIAERYGSTVDAFAHTNNLADPTRIYAGQRLKIPGGRTAIDPQSTAPYVFQATDTLAVVASRFGTSWQELVQMNGLVSPDILYAGHIIQVPATTNVVGSEGALHVVGHNETLFDIALRYGISPQLLATVNRIHNPALIYPGQFLMVPGQRSSQLPRPYLSVGVRPLPAAQGKSLVVRVRTTEPVTLSGRVFEQTVRFAEEDGVYYGLVGLHVFTEPGLYELTLTATDSHGGTSEIGVDVVVEADRFGYERIPASSGYLDPEAVAAERERLDAMRSRFTETRGWSGALLPPCGGTVSSYFGTHRAYSDGPYTSYHAGVDLRGATGTPVYAPAGGTVVLTEQFIVRGNALMIDHGWGVLSGYWHLSTIEVRVGQEVAAGDLVGRIGNTGLSTGSHLHWEMWVGGVSVDPLQWLEPFYPWPERRETSSERIAN